MNTEERQLAEMLHRVAPEPPRRVTVEDVASRLASQAGGGRGGYREPRPRRGFSWHGFSRGGRGWTPVLAALSVFAVAGTSAGIATVVTSHHSPAPAPGDGRPPSSASVSSAPSSTAPSPPPASAGTPLRIAGGMWGAELIHRQSFAQDSLTGSGKWLFALTDGLLVRIDPATGQTASVALPGGPPPGPPVVVGNTVWVASSDGNGVLLRGFGVRSLAPVASVSVPAIGRVSSSAQGVLAAGPDGVLYLAAGDTVAVVDPASGDRVQRIFLVGGPASSVAVSPDGSRLYVGTVPSGSFRLLTFDLATRREHGSSRMTAGGAGNLVATSGGVWGTAGSGMSEWVWFAPGGDLTRSFRVGQGAGGGLESVPSVSGGAVWVGGTHQLVCANPATGKVLASTAIPADNGVVEYFGSVTVLSSGRTYALYQDQAAHLSGVAALTPPARC